MVTMAEPPLLPATAPPRLIASLPSVRNGRPPGLRLNGRRLIASLPIEYRIPENQAFFLPGVGRSGHGRGDSRPRPPPTGVATGSPPARDVPRGTPPRGPPAACRRPSPLGREGLMASRDKGNTPELVRPGR